jgi:hypothetical protein
VVTILHVLFGIALLTVACLLLLAFPVIRCPRCLGRRVRRTRTSRGTRKVRKCRACRGTGHVVPPGAALVHRMFWAVAGERIRERRKQENAERLDARKERAC